MAQKTHTKNKPISSTIQNLKLKITTVARKKKIFYASLLDKNGQETQVWLMRYIICIFWCPSRGTDSAGMCLLTYALPHFPHWNTNMIPGGKIVMSRVGGDKHMLNGGVESAWWLMASWSHHACSWLSFSELFIMLKNKTIHSFKSQLNIILTDSSAFQSHLKFLNSILNGENHALRKFIYIYTHTHIYIYKY